MSTLGPGALDDLRAGAKDSDERVRGQAVVEAYNLLELERPERRWPIASDRLIADVQRFLTEMQQDQTRHVRDNPTSMLGLIVIHRSTP